MNYIQYHFVFVCTVWVHFFVSICLWKTKRQWHRSMQKGVCCVLDGDNWQRRRTGTDVLCSCVWQVYQRTLSPLPSNDNQTCAPPQETYLSSLSCPLATNRTHSTRRWDLTGDSSNVDPIKKAALRAVFSQVESLFHSIKAKQLAVAWRTGGLLQMEKSCRSFSLFVFGICLGSRYSL